MKRFLFFLILIAGLIGAAEYLQRHSPAEVSKRRDKLAHTSTGDVKVAIVWPDQNLYLGAQLAAEEINGRGGVLGRKIQPVSFSEEPGSELDTAHEIADDIEYFYVIGHSGSAVAVPASVTYQFHGILYFAVNATVPELTDHGFDFVFRNIPDNGEFAKAGLSYCASTSKKRAIIFSPRSRYSENFVSLFVANSDAFGVQVVSQKSITRYQDDFREQIANAQKTPFDIILMLDALPRAAELITQIRQMGVKQPILGGDAIDSPNLWKLAGKNAEGVLVASVFSDKSDNPGVQKFVQNFHNRYKSEPDLASAQGYESMKVLAQAIQRIGSLSPIEVSSSLRFDGPFDGLEGSVSYTPTGNIQGKDVFIKVVKNGAFDLSATVER